MEKNSEENIRMALSMSQNNQKLLIVQMRKLIKELESKSEHVKRLEMTVSNERARSKRYREECARAWLEVEEAKIHEDKAKNLVTSLRVEMNKLKVSFGNTLQQLNALRSSKRRTSSSSPSPIPTEVKIKKKSESLPSIVSK